MESPFGVDHGYIAKYSAAYGNNRVAIKDMADAKAKKIKAMAKEKAKGIPKGKPGEVVAKPHEHVDSWFAGKTISKAKKLSRAEQRELQAAKSATIAANKPPATMQAVATGKKAGKFAKTPRALALGAAGVAAAGGGYAYSQRKKSA